MSEKRPFDREAILTAIVDKAEKGGEALVLQGPTGTGKSTLMRQAAARLAPRGYDHILIRGRTAPPLIVKEIFLKAQEEGVDGVQEIFEAQRDINDKLRRLVEDFLSYRKTLIILDHFEENQTRSGKIQGKELKEFLDYFRGLLKEADSAVSILVTGLHKVPGFDTLPVPGYSQQEYDRFLEEATALKRLSEDDRQAVRQDIGGNPMALTLLDRIAFQEFPDGTVSWKKLKESIPGLKRRVVQDQIQGEDLIRIFLNKLLTSLSAEQSRLIRWISLFPLPVGSAVLKSIGEEPADSDRSRLENLALLTYYKTPDRYEIHPFSAALVLEKTDIKERKEMSGQAAQLLLGLKDKEGKKSIDDYLAARKLLLQAGRWDQAAEVTLEMEAYLTGIGFYSFSFQLLIEVAGKKLSHQNRALVHFQIGQLCLLKENYPPALKYLLTAYLLFTKLQSPHAEPVKKMIAGLKEKMENDAFKETFREFDISPAEFDPEMLQHQEFLDFITGLTDDAVRFQEKSSAEKERIVELLENMINEPAYDTADLRKFKVYFQMLLKYIHGEEIGKYRGVLTPELKILFDETLYRKK